MKYNPLVHHRRSIRLAGYDYAQAGAYFITLCCQDRVCRFGNIVGAGLAPAQMILNEYGRIAHDEWVKLSERFENIELDVFQIMPNHMHGIVVLRGDVGAGLDPALGQPQRLPQQPQGLPLQTPPTIGSIIGAYKSLVANKCRAGAMGKIWQRNYYEHIIRDESSYQNISKYIVNNPSKWLEDRFYEH